MVRLFPLSLLAVCAGVALAEQHVLDDDSVRALTSWSYQNCGLPEDTIHINNIKVLPDPPKPGQDLTVTVSATATKPIVDGSYADVTVKLGIIKLLTKRFDVCKEARAANATIQCPVEEGDYVVSHTVALPKEIPKAKFKVHVEGHSADEEDMFCLNLDVDFMPKFPFPRAW